MSTILLCKSENNMNINNNSIFQSASSVKEIDAETIRLKREEGGGILVQMSQQGQSQQGQSSSGSLSDHDEKKMRRQIANSNERRRMQSINAGFQSLRQLLPHHEGEKLSKAAILQQTAEYIDKLELERNQLITQTNHLQRLVDSLGGGNNNNNNNECPQQIITSPSAGNGTVGAFKKRKLDQVVTVQTISDSSDEGLGSMSPEPVSQMILTNGSSGTITKTHMVSATSVTTINVKDYVNLQNQMETERRHRIQLEEQLRNLEMQVYSNHQSAPSSVGGVQKYQIQAHEEVDDVDTVPVGTVIEEKIILRQQQQPEDIHYHVPHVPHHQYVVVRTSTPGSSPKNIIMNDNDEDSRTLSSDELHKDDGKLVRKMSPKHQQREVRIPSILEKAIKAEPKVEVERISSPGIHFNISEEIAVQSPPRLTGSPTTIRTTYPSNNQRPNLETIVEAIRHLEGDGAFDMDDGQEQQQQPTKVQTPTTQEAPLALTTSNKYHQTSGVRDHSQPFLKFRPTSTSSSGLPTFSMSVPSSQQQQQQRPGVIVVKQSS